MKTVCGINHGERCLSWFHRHCPFLLHALSISYAWVVRSRLYLYQQGWLRTHRLPCPVASVGNLTVGGTGKTPVTMWLANWLHSKGIRVAILSRGYRRTSTADYVLVSNRDKVLATHLEVGDEPFLMAQSCPGVVVAVGRDRYQLGLWVLQQMEIDCFILDDGYQHIRLHRDCNLLLFDALDLEGIGALFPAGRLREPLSAASRATAILATRVDQSLKAGQVLQAVEAAIGQKIPSINIEFHTQSIKHLRTWQTESGPWMAGKRAVIFSGIGNAFAFRQTVTEMGVFVVQELEFPDHYSYSAEDIHVIRAAAQGQQVDVVLTTEKDAVKILTFLHEEDNMWAVQIETNITKGKEHLQQTLECLRL